jgi:hypothetical protein
LYARVIWGSKAVAIFDVDLGVGRPAVQDEPLGPFSMPQCSTDEMDRCERNLLKVLNVYAMVQPSDGAGHDFA